MPASAPMTTKDGRFGYQAAGGAALQPLVFLHGIGGELQPALGIYKYYGGERGLFGICGPDLRV